MNLGGGEILVIVIVAVFIFGPDKLPQLFRLLGRASAEIKSFQNMASSEFEKISTITTDSKDSASKQRPTSKSETQHVNKSETQEEIVHPILDEDDSAK